MGPRGRGGRKPLPHRAAGHAPWVPTASSAAAHPPRSGAAQPSPAQRATTTIGQRRSTLFNACQAEVTFLLRLRGDTFAAVQHPCSPTPFHIRALLVTLLAGRPFGHVAGVRFHIEGPNTMTKAEMEGEHERYQSRIATAEEAEQRGLYKEAVTQAPHA